MTKEEIQALVRATLNEELGKGPRQAMSVYGNASRKMLGQIVGDALLHSPVVVIDGSGLRSVASRKVMWKIEDES